MCVVIVVPTIESVGATKLLINDQFFRSKKKI